MSSSPPSDHRRAGRPAPTGRPRGPTGHVVAARRLAGWVAVVPLWWSARPLRTRLVVAVLALLAVACVAIGGVTAVALHWYLMGQLDQQLVAAARRAQAVSSDPPVWAGRPGRTGSAPPVPSGVPLGAIAVERGGDDLLGQRLTEEGVARRTLTPEQMAPLVALPADGTAHTRPIPGLGDYRLIAQQTRDGRVLITGLPLEDLQRTIWWMVVAVGGVAGTGLVIAGAAGTIIVRRALRPLRRLAATAGQVAELPLDRGEVALPVRVPVADTDPRTEVGQVGAAFNRMLAHVGAALAARHASEQRVRRFVADASHELRTPLAAIRGYAELTRRSPRRVPPDVAHALRRVESESTRMTRLVDDLLLLARLDAGRPLARVPVDLSALVVDAVGDARAAGPGHVWRLDLPAEAVRVPGDGERLHQVVGNLLANARTHTPPGSRVTTSLAVRGGAVELTVTDDGPGVPEALLPEIFERFSRGDGSRSRAAGSTGLGLSIVAAVVEAHGGTVAVTSRPGRTAFQVRLPLLDRAARPAGRPAAYAEP